MKKITHDDVVQWWKECVSPPNSYGIRRGILPDTRVYFRRADLEDVLAQFNPHEPYADPLTAALDRAAGRGNIWWSAAGVGNPDLEWPEDRCETASRGGCMMTETVREELMQWWEKYVSEPDERGVRRSIIPEYPDSRLYFRVVDLEDILDHYDPQEHDIDPVVAAIDRAAGPENFWWSRTETGNCDLEWPEDRELRMREEALLRERARSEPDPDY